MSKIFFVRHAKVGNLSISEFGKKKLQLLSGELQKYDFNPEIVITTSTKRCIETGKVLAPGVKAIICDELPFSCVWDNHQNIKSSLLKTIEPYIKENKDILVVVHDCMSTIMALSLVEKRGVDISWNCLPKDLIRPPEASGILVNDRVYLCIS